jgi:hypothetical protein
VITASDLRSKTFSPVKYVVPGYIPEGVTPEQAEAEAKAAGLPPFESQPGRAEFDPMDESRWSIIMAIAWIAWRDPELVMRQGPEYRTRCASWVPREWNQLAQNGKSFANRKGWFLEPWPKVSAMTLTMIDNDLRGRGHLPESAHPTPGQAEKELWRALSEERLKAEGFDKRGALVEIPAREWAHLKLFEERSLDVFKYAAMDTEEPYTQVRFRRDDLTSLWPREYAKAKSEGDCRRWLITLMRQSPGERRKPKLQYQKEAQAKFRPLAARQFQRAWDAAVQESAATSWCKAGRLKTKSNHRTK